MKEILTTLLTIVILIKGEDNQNKPGIIFTVEDNYDWCDGEDSANYTGIGEFNSDCDCSVRGIDIGTGPYDNDVLTATLESGLKSVNQIKTIARTIEPMGAFFQITQLSLVISGNLEARYLLKRAVFQNVEFLKRCSSALGSDYASSSSLDLLIVKKLDMNVFLTPGDPLDVFKKSASTICNGRAFIVYNKN